MQRSSGLSHLLRRGRASRDLPSSLPTAVVLVSEAMLTGPTQAAQDSIPMGNRGAARELALATVELRVLPPPPSIRHLSTKVVAVGDLRAHAPAQPPAHRKVAPSREVTSPAAISRGGAKHPGHAVRATSRWRSVDRTWRAIVALFRGASPMRRALLVVAPLAATVVILPYTNCALAGSRGSDRRTFEKQTVRASEANSGGDGPEASAVITAKPIPKQLSGSVTKPAAPSRIPDFAPRPTARAAANTLAAGNTEEALVLYRQLATDNPGDTVLAEAARILQARADRPSAGRSGSWQAR